jgi:glycosyltransferase involved in cell wall biosynthesis
MKLLVFAHVPPPHHGQSQMVQYIVEGLRRRTELGIEIHHVDARLSGDLQDVGTARGGKIPRLIRHCQEARRCGRRHGIQSLYYVPSPPRRVPLYRDWIALALLRSTFPNLIYHWHSAGLGDWIETAATPPERAISQRLLGRPDLSLVLAEVLRKDAVQLGSKRVEVVNNAVLDPSPDFHNQERERRRERLDQLRSQGGTLEVLFLALCSEDKGLFDAIQAIHHANARCRTSGSRLKFRLSVAGGFPDPATERRFRDIVASPELAGSVRYVGFLKGPDKQAAMLGSDVLLFPSYYAFETHPLSLVEAMAHGMLIVATRWRGIPEMLPGDLAPLVEPRNPEALAAALMRVPESNQGPKLRERYESRYTLDRFLDRFAQAVKTGESRA